MSQVRWSLFLYSVKFGRWLNMQYFTDTFSWLFMFLSWLDNCLLELCESVYTCTSHARETIPNQICCTVVARLEKCSDEQEPSNYQHVWQNWWNIKPCVLWLMIKSKKGTFKFDCQFLVINFILMCDCEYFTFFRILWLIPSFCIQ